MVLQTYSNDSRFFWRCWGVNVAVEPVAASFLLWLHAIDNGTRRQAESKAPPARRVDVNLVRFMPPAPLFSQGRLGGPKWSFCFFRDQLLDHFRQLLGVFLLRTDLDHSHHTLAVDQHS